MKLSFSNTAIGRLRMAGISEGISFLILLFIAMPLKYFAGWPDGVKYVGWIHGLLFIFYVFALISISISAGWSFKRVAIAFIASLLPFGTFILDRQWRKDEEVFLKNSRN